MRRGSSRSWHIMSTSFLPSPSMLPSSTASMTVSMAGLPTTWGGGSYPANRDSTRRMGVQSSIIMLPLRRMHPLLLYLLYKSKGKAAVCDTTMDASSTDNDPHTASSSKRRRVLPSGAGSSTAQSFWIRS